VCPDVRNSAAAACSSALGGVCEKHAHAYGCWCAPCNEVAWACPVMVLREGMLANTSHIELLRGLS